MMKMNVSQSNMTVPTYWEKHILLPYEQHWEGQYVQLSIRFLPWQAHC